MNIIYLRSPLSEKQSAEIKEEFKQFEFFSTKDLEGSPLELLKARYWDFVEILYDENLSLQELAQAHQLRWVHSPSPHVNHICLPELKEKNNILLSTSSEAHAVQIAEYILAGSFCFAKQLIYWHDFQQELHKQSASKNEAFSSSWILQEKTFLQIGLGPVGNEITNRCKKLGMKVWGVSNHSSFHPHCDKTFSTHDLHSILPAADIVSIFLPKDKQFKHWFSHSKLELMKEDSILIVVSSTSAVNLDSLGKLAESGKFRGILLDIPSISHLPKHSPLRNIHRVLITPQIAKNPPSNNDLSFQTFRHNLRQYVHGNFSDMKNLVSSQILY